MNLAYAPVHRAPRHGVASTRAPVRRSMPARPRARSLPTTFLVVAGAFVLFDIEFGLAWLLHVAASLGH